MQDKYDFNKSLVRAEKAIKELLMTFKKLGEEAREVAEAIRQAKTLEQLPKT